MLNVLCLIEFSRKSCFIFEYIYIPNLHSLIPPPDMTQEIASRGMGLVYEMSPPSEREALVNLLVGTLMEGRRFATC